MRPTALLVNTNTVRPLVAPIGLEYVGSYLKDKGVDVQVFDFAFRDDIESYISSMRPDFIGFGIRNSDDCSWPSARSFIPELKVLYERIRNCTDVPVILGGGGLSVMPEQIICSGELQQGTIHPVLPEWSPRSVDVYMIYPFQLSFSNLIRAFYDTALEIITENTAMTEE